MTCPYGSGSCGTTVTTVAHTASTVAHHAASHVSSLPFTGGDVVGLALIGIGALAGGVALVRSGRPKAVA